MSNTGLLRNLVAEGLEQRGLSGNQEYTKRAQYELSVIEKQGFTTYFLVMWDIARYVNNTPGMLSGPGRGSGAGSLVVYSLGITKVDPLRYGLYFERFLNPDRVSPPDIDYDVNDRDKVIAYIEERYGKDRVARVGSVNFVRTKSAIRDIGRVLGLDYAFADELAALVPPAVAGLWDSLEKECKVEPRLLDEKYSVIMSHVKTLWGVARSYGTHAGGVAIAPGPITSFVPLYQDKDGNPVSQFDWRGLEAAGLLKFDILGLSTLQVIELARSYIRERKGIDINLESLPDDDEKTFLLVRRGDLDGVFQLGGSESIKRLTTSMAPTSIGDLSLVSALFRPGPLSSHLVNDAVSIRHGKKKPSYIYPALEPILGPSYSVCILQEQVMKICTDLCGYTAAQADTMRKILGKKKKEDMAKERPKFISGAIEGGIPPDIAEQLFSMLEDYAQYLFCAAHSLAYAVMSYWTAYLKAHYPVEFYAALLAHETNPDMIPQYVASARAAGIEILPPDVNASGVLHQPEGDNIRYGLSHIKGMPLATAEAIVLARDQAL
jgi:DNA polymerase-3 subunit alpha